MKKVEQELKKLSDVVNPSEKWKAETRRILMSQISAQTNEVEKNVNFFDRFLGAIQIFVKDSKMVFVVKPLVVLFLVSSIALSGSGFTVDAARQSVPGDKLYLVKRALERAQLSFAVNPDQKIELEVNFANERINEIKILTQKTEQKDQEKVQSVIEDIQDGFNSIKNQLDEIQSQDSNQAIKIAKFVEENTDDVADSLDKVNDLNVEETFQVEAAIASVDEAGMMALSVIIDNFEYGNLAIEEKQKILERINEKIEAVNVEVESIQNELVDKTDSVNTDTEENVVQNYQEEQIKSEVEIKEESAEEETDDGSGITNSDEKKDESAVVENDEDNVEESVEIEDIKKQLNDNVTIFLDEASHSLKQQDLKSAFEKLNQGKIEIKTVKEKIAQIDSTENIENESNETDQNDDESFQVQGFIVEPD